MTHFNNLLRARRAALPRWQDRWRVPLTREILWRNRGGPSTPINLSLFSKRFLYLWARKIGSRRQLNSIFWVGAFRRWDVFIEMDLCRRFIFIKRCRCSFFLYLNPQLTSIENPNNIKKSAPNHILNNFPYHESKEGTWLTKSSCLIIELNKAELNSI